MLFRDIGVAALRHRREEIACDNSAPIRDAGLFQPTSGARDPRRGIEDSALCFGDGCKNAAQKSPVAAADIDDVAISGEIMRRQDGRRRPARKISHVCVEDGGPFGMKGKMLKRAHAEEMLEGSLSGAHRVPQFAPRPPGE